MTRQLSATKKHGMDMTEGNIFRHLLLFAIPLFAGNLFQQFYNMVDTWTVGNYVSDTAYSAVGTVSPICNVMIAVFMGLSNGAGIVISQYFGAKNDEKVHDAVHTAIAMTLVMAVICTAAGILLTPAMLGFMKMPAEAFAEAKTYLYIYFGGISGLMFYNMGAGILRAVGDSKRPFYFLVVTALCNVVLDLAFVLIFHMGVEGVALATILAQFISAGATMIALMRLDSSVRVIPREVRFHREMLSKIVSIGIPSGVQMGITSFSNVFVQSYINQFGTYVMGGWTSYNKLDQILMLVSQSVSLSVSTFVGQNLGRHQMARAKQGVRVGLVMSLVVSGALSALLYAFAPTFAAIFNPTEEVVYYSTLFVRLMVPFHLINIFSQIYAGALRGAGNTRAPMLIMLSSYTVFRQIYLFIMSHYIANEIIPLALGYPAGWAMCSLLATIYYHRVPLDKYNVVKAEEIQGERKEE